jgi:hypothetical protein
MNRNSYHHSEWYYLARHFTDVRMVVSMIAIVFLTVLRQIKKHFRPNRIHYYPPEIKSLSNFSSLEPSFAISDQIQVPAGPLRLKLATGYLEFNQWPEWNIQFNDSEQFASLHRWNWLLRALTDELEPVDSQWGEALIRSWLFTMPCLPSGDAGDSYTAGERISNACLFFRYTSDSWVQIPHDISSALHCMALDLANHIEYFPGDLSGNHVFNNARALLFAGHCCEDPKLITLGRSLIQERLPVLLESNGFLREGSSHYQFLFTRWLLEMRILAEECSDYETLDVLILYITQAVDACRFFQVPSTNSETVVPTFGDVSPDCEPEWLWDLPFSSPAYIESSGIYTPSSNLSGWAMLFSDWVSNVSHDHVVDTISNRDQKSFAILPWRSFSDAGWHRIDYLGWTAILHTENSSGPAISTHAHYDLCSFVLYKDGRELLIDAGRLDYTASAIGRYGIKAHAHNTVTLNGCPPMLLRGDRFFPERYRRALCSVDIKENENNLVMRIDHDGFMRLGGGIKHHIREFIFSVDNVEIIDRLEGNGSYCMESFFHSPSFIPLSDVKHGIVDHQVASHYERVNIDVLEAPSAIEMTYLAASTEPIGGWQFSAYGQRSLSMTKHFSIELNLPATCRYRITDREL